MTMVAVPGDEARLASPDAAGAQGFPRCHWMLLPGECLQPIARAAVKVIDVACGPIAYKTQLLA
jgi:hypothetical protein